MQGRSVLPALTVFRVPRRADVVNGGGRQGLPMYDVRFSKYDLWNSRACARIRRSESGGGNVEQRAGVVRKRQWQAGPAYVRGTIFDVRFGKLAR